MYCATGHTTMPQLLHPANGYPGLPVQMLLPHTQVMNTPVVHHAQKGLQRNSKEQVYPETEGLLLRLSSMKDCGSSLSNPCAQPEPSRGFPTQSPDISAVHNVIRSNGQIPYLQHVQSVYPPYKIVNDFLFHHMPTPTPTCSTDGKTTQSLTTPTQQLRGIPHGGEVIQRVEAQPTLVMGTYLCAKTNQNLEKFYALCKRPSNRDLRRLSKYLGVNSDVIQIWFYNRQQEARQLRIAASKSRNLPQPTAFPPAETFPGFLVPASQPAAISFLPYPMAYMAPYGNRTVQGAQR